jgi:aspartate oxidase
VHGANRLASNSLLEGLVFADRAGRSVTRKSRAKTGASLSGVNAGVEETGADQQCEPIRDQMRQLMTASVGLQRSEASLLQAEQELERLTRDTPEEAWRTRNQLLVAGLITQAARRRRESRGGHRRTDYPPDSLKREAV